MIGELPSLVTFPPKTADVLVMPLLVGVVTVGTVTGGCGSVVKTETGAV